MSWLGDMRSIVPKRRLTFLESRMIAERQALMLLRRLQISDAPVPAELLVRLPHLAVGSRPLRAGSAGGTNWRNHRWTIVLNRNEPLTRQRFSLGHELKHVLDHPFVDIIYGHAPTKRHRATEQVCNYFAACLLMPRPWVKRAYCAGVQDVGDLAELFEVSPEAMQIRLLQLGLVESYPRHSEIDNAYLRSGPVSPLELAA